jgi:hypothetical protein
VSGHLLNVTFADGQFVTSVFGGSIISSTDGVTWVKRWSAAGKGPGGLTYGNGLWVVVGASLLILTSVDASNWVQQHAEVDTTSRVFNTQIERFFPGKRLFLYGILMRISVPS